MKRILVLLCILGLVCACGPEARKTTEQKLPSGKTMKVIGIGTMHFGEGEPALTLQYETGSDIEDIDALRREAEEIWPVFRVNVEKDGKSNALITASAAPERTGLFSYETRNFNFVITKRPDGTWNFHNWGRNYEEEAREIATAHLEALEHGDMGEAAAAYHYPADFSLEELGREKRDIATILGILSARLGAVTEYMEGESNPETLFFALQTASQQYWEKHPYFMARVYDVEFANQGKGFVSFHFSIVNDRMALSHVFYGLPADDPDAETMFKSLNDDLMQQMKGTQG